MTQRDEINRINLYPIADHDTGTNLAATLGAVLQGLRGPSPVAGPLWRQVASDAADGARGNAGAILAQYFQGVADVLATNPRPTPAVWAEAAASGSRQARAAMTEPCEGTMVTVIQAFAEELRLQAATGERDFRSCFAGALTRTREALHGTRQQIPILRAAGVVDAGAMGFVELLEGINEFLEVGRTGTLGEIAVEMMAAGVDVSRDTGGHRRFSVECLLNASHVDREGLKAALLKVPLSDQVITGTRDQVALHAHVDDPALFLATVERFGTVSRQRIDDLTQPDRPASRNRPPVGIAIDSGADLPSEEMARLDIQLVPQRLSIDGRDQIDRVSITPHEFYAAMRTSRMPPRTSQPAPGDFRRLFQFMLTHHESVIAVSLARTLSGTLQAAEGAAARTEPARVHVFDTGNVSAGHGLLAIWAGEAAQAGLDAQSILTGLARMRPRTQVYALVKDVRYAVRGGRAPRVALTLTRLLRFFLTLKIRANGRLGLMGCLWGRQQLPERFARKVMGRLNPAGRYRVIVGHCDCPAEARRVEAALQTSGRTIDRSWIVEIGVAIGAHAGPGSLVIGVQDYEPPAP